MTARSEKLKETAGIWFILAIFMAAFAFAAHNLRGQSVVWEPFRPIAQLKMPKWSGSGTLIAVDGGRGLVLSCRHVAQKVGNNVELQWLATGQKTAGEVIEVVPRTGTRTGVGRSSPYENPFSKGFFGKRPGSRKPGPSWQNDLALIEADIPAGLEPVPVVEFDPDNGPWTCQGFRKGTAYAAVTNKAEKKGDSIILSALFWGGESGGAVLDKYGQLVGVIVASSAKGSYGIAANGEALRTMLEKYGKQY